MKLDAKKEIMSIFRTVKRMDRWDKAQLFTQVLFIVVCLSAILISPTGRFSEAFLWLNRVIGKQLTALAMTTAVFAFGILAFEFKRESQYWYGLVEILFGGAYVYNITVNIQPGEQMFAKWATICGCVYVIARGLNNMQDARGKKARTSTAAQAASETVPVAADI
jgi:hypothetical protein